MPETDYVVVSQNKKEFIINWQDMNNAINFLSKAEKVLYDPIRDVYIIDGVDFSNNFFSDIEEKLSHLLNITSKIRRKRQIMLPKGALDDSFAKQITPFKVVTND
jgi:hypothetical protein